MFNQPKQKYKIVLRQIFTAKLRLQKKHSQIPLQVLDFLAPQQGLEPWTP